MARTAAALHLVDPVVVLGVAVRALLQVIAGERRAVLVLDDLHWADRDTLDLLAYLCAGAAPVPLVLAARDDERGPAMLDTVGRHADWLPLDRLCAERVEGRRGKVRMQRVRLAEHAEVAPIRARPKSASSSVVAA